MLTIEAARVMARNTDTDLGTSESAQNVFFIIFQNNFIAEILHHYITSALQSIINKQKYTRVFVITGPIAYHSFYL